MSTSTRTDLSAGAQCPLPHSDDSRVLLAHGGGGRMSQRLIDEVFVEAFRNPHLEALHDGARLQLESGRVAFSTDSFVINPLIFPGGDIGSLAVHGTVNDLAMCGAQPVALSASYILEEGLSMDTLRQVVSSMGEAARAAGVPIVTGDTKVVDRGKGDGIFINTSGIGMVPEGIQVAPTRVAAGDRILLSGALAEHGIAIMSVREGLAFETSLESDSAALHGLVEAVLQAGGEGVHVLRDPTRGGVASAANEIAREAHQGVVLEEAAIPLREEVRGACEILGLDPLYVANEGKCLAIVSPQVAEPVLEAMRRHPLGRDAALIGEIVNTHAGKVSLRSRIGGSRIVDMMSGEQLPRIC